MNYFFLLKIFFFFCKIKKIKFFFSDKKFVYRYFCNLKNIKKFELPNNFKKQIFSSLNFQKQNGIIKWLFSK